MQLHDFCQQMGFDQAVECKLFEHWPELWENSSDELPFFMERSFYERYYPLCGGPSGVLERMAEVARVTAENPVCCRYAAMLYYGHFAAAPAITMDYFPLPEKCGNDTVRLVLSGHGFFFEGTENVFFTAAATAKKSLWIITPYFVPTHDFSKTLRMAAARGVDVRIIIPEINNHWYVKLASASFYEPLLTDGVRIFHRQGVFSHAKAMLIDDCWVFMGSSNCDVRSFRLNFELDLLIESGDFPAVIRKQFLTELRKSVEITLPEFQKRSKARKLAEAVCALISPVL